VSIPGHLRQRDRAPPRPQSGRCWRASSPALRSAARHSATLHVTVTGLYLTSYAGGQSATLGNDTLESEAVLVGIDGRELARYPVMSIMAPSFSGAWYLPDINQRRIDALVANNAQWIRRALGR
jgi:hypothetical protein